MILFPLVVHAAAVDALSVLELKAGDGDVVGLEDHWTAPIGERHGLPWEGLDHLRCPQHSRVAVNFSNPHFALIQAWAANQHDIPGLRHGNGCMADRPAGRDLRARWVGAVVARAGHVQDPCVWQPREGEVMVRRFSVHGDHDGAPGHIRTRLHDNPVEHRVIGIALSPDQVGGHLYAANAHFRCAACGAEAFAEDADGRALVRGSAGCRSGFDVHKENHGSAWRGRGFTRSSSGPAVPPPLSPPPPEHEQNPSVRHAQSNPSNSLLFKLHFRGPLMIGRPGVMPSKIAIIIRIRPAKNRDLFARAAWFNLLGTGKYLFSGRSLSKERRRNLKRASPLPFPGPR